MSGAETVIVYGAVMAGCAAALTVGFLLVIVMIIEIADDARENGWK